MLIFLYFLFYCWFVYLFDWFQQKSKILQSLLKEQIFKAKSNSSPLSGDIRHHLSWQIWPVNIWKHEYFYHLITNGIKNHYKKYSFTLLTYYKISTRKIENWLFFNKLSTCELYRKCYNPYLKNNILCLFIFFISWYKDHYITPSFRSASSNLHHAL